MPQPPQGLGRSIPQISTRSRAPLSRRASASRWQAFFQAFPQSCPVAVSSLRRSRRHLTWPHNAHPSLRPQRRQPVAQQVTNLLLQQHLFYSRRDCLQLGRCHVALCVLRQHPLLVVILDVIIRDSNTVAEPNLDKSQQLHPLSPSLAELFESETMSIDIFLPARIGLAVILLALRNILTQRHQLSIKLLVRNSRLGLQLCLLQDQQPIDKTPDRELSRAILVRRPIRLNLLEPHLLVDVAFENQIVIHHSNDAVQHRPLPCAGKRGRWSQRYRGLLRPQQWPAQQRCHHHQRRRSGLPPYPRLVLCRMHLRSSVQY